MIEQVGRRLYVTGNSYAIKDRLKSAGCHWDAERRQWWIGTTQRAALEAVVSSSGGNQPQTRDDSERADRVIGKARYKGRTYRVVWAGQTKRGRAAKLCFLDGTHQFWADQDAIEWLTRYEEPRSLDSILDFAERAKAGRAGTCAECGQSSDRLRELPDSSGIVAGICPRCASEPAYTRSYA